MNYKVQQQAQQFVVFETKTNQAIANFKDQSEAKKLLRHLNLGGCFDGFTPSFFLTSVGKKK